ncbi:hypothetical protein RFI_26107, partial [Reticulomyxa filosa]
SNSNSNGDGYNNEKHVSGDVSVHLKMANEEVISYHDDPNNSNHNFKMTTPTSRHRHRNRVTFDWAGKEFHQITRHYGIGYTSENVLSSTTEREHVDQSTPENTFFMPFDVFSKLRHQIQQCLHALVRACPKIFDDLWRKLLPNDEKSAISRRPFGGPTVLTVTIYDPHPRVRHAAFAFLHSLMDKCPLPRLLACIHQTSTTGGAKGTLDIGASRSAIATANASRTAFTPMSDRALSILQAIHYGLMFSLDSQESQDTCKTEIVKCLKTVVQMTDCSRLKEGYLCQLTEICLTQLSSAKGSYKTGLFVLLAAIFDQKCFIEELDVFFHTQNTGKKTRRQTSGSSMHKHKSSISINIMTTILQELKSSPVVVAVAISTAEVANPHSHTTYPMNSSDEDDIEHEEMAHPSKQDGNAASESSGDARSVISSMARNYRTYLAQWWSKGLKDAVATGLGSAQMQTVVETLKMIHHWMVIIPISPGVTPEDAVFGMLRLSDCVRIMEQWLPRLFNRYKNNKEHSGIRSKLLNILLCFKKWHWDLFSLECQQQLIQCVYDSVIGEKVPHVRAIACRVIGSLGAFLDDKQFCATSAQLLTQCLRNLLLHTNNNIRIHFVNLSLFCFFVFFFFFLHELNRLLLLLCCCCCCCCYFCYFEAMDKKVQLLE